MVKSMWHNYLSWYKWPEWLPIGIIYFRVKMLVTQLCLPLTSMGFSRQEYWSG